jgi:chromosomal replication initiator protein
VPEQSAESIWNAIRAELRAETPDFRFEIWLDPLELAAIDGRTLYVRAPEHIRTSVAERYLPLLRAAAARCLHERAVVELVGRDWRAPEPIPTAHQGPAGAAAPPAGTRLNPRYTFDQFVIGEGSRFAHAAALAVAELPAQAYNPLFLHGPPGLGKTHLLHAIGNYVQRYGSGLRVVCTTVEDFTSDFVGSLRERRTDAFRARFRSADLVLVDDVQFLARRRATREEFFHTFNALIESGRQLVMTSDCGPEELPDLETRLAERFRSGLVVGIDPPTPEVRRAILRKRAAMDGVEVAEEVLEEIAGLVTSSVRALEGALIRVVAYASLRAERPTAELARTVLGRLGNHDRGASCGIPEIVDAAAQEFGVERDDVMARNRRPDVAMARQVAMYVARELTDHSLPEIGRGVGGRNHTTVLHAVNRVTASMDADPRVRNAVDNLRKRLSGVGASRDE